MKQINQSPIDNTELFPYLSCLDYTVSRETFTVFVDNKSELLVTTPRPLERNLAKYYESEDYISHSNSSKSILDKVYQLVRSYTIKQKVKLCNSFNGVDKNMLDIGAGTGDFLVACEKNGWKITGVEPNSKAKALIKTKLRGTDQRIFENIEELDLEKYDVITMWHVLEHVPNLIDYISTLKQLLKPKGTLIVAVPNYKSYDAKYYKEYWAAYDVPRHLWHFSKAAIQKLFLKENMTVIKTLPMKFDSFYVSLLSEKYKTGKSNYLKAFLVGLKSNWLANKSKEYSSIIYVIRKG